MYALLKKFLGWADEGSRKRRLPEADHDTSVDSLNPKKYCCYHNNSIYNQQDILELDKNANSTPIFDPEDFRQLKTHNKYLGYTNDSVRQKKNRTNPKSYSRNSASTLKSNLFRQKFKMRSAQGKSCQNSRSYLVSNFSTLSKTNQLREKQQYSEMLQSFRPPKIQLIQATPNGKISGKQIVEVIDVENYESSTSLRLTPTRVNVTPKTNSLTHWYTPITGSPKISNPFKQQQYEEIHLTDDDDDDSLVEQIITPNGSSNTRLKKVVANRSVEVIATNTLRDRLAAKKVTRLDYVPRVTEQYKGLMDQRYKEAEQLKKEAELLACHNRHQRMVGLEEQLARTLKICKPFLEDQEDEEKQPSLPELTSEMMQIIQNALGPHRKDEALVVEHFGLKITRKDICTLAGLNWLNDEIINFYMNLLIARGSQEGYPNVHAMNTFFYPKLLSGGHSSLKRWTRKIDIFNQDIIVVPIHLGVHWCMSIIDFRDKSIRYYDSMGGQNSKCLSALKKYLEDESLDKKKKSYDMSNWNLENMSDIPQQMNGSDCGVFSCTFAEFICANREITFSQDNMPYFRNKMVYEILEVKIL